MDDAFLVLQFAGAAQESGAERGAAEAFEDGRPDDQIGDAGLVLDGDEDDAVGAARTLPDQHDPGDREPPVDRQMGELGGGDQALAGKLGTQKGERVALQGEAEACIILDDMLPQRHFRQKRHRPCFAGLRRQEPPPSRFAGPPPPRFGGRVGVRGLFAMLRRAAAAGRRAPSRPIILGGGRARPSGTRRLRQGARARRARGRCAATAPADPDNRFPGPRRAAPHRPRQTLLSGATRDAAPAPTLTLPR